MFCYYSKVLIYKYGLKYVIFNSFLMEWEKFGFIECLIINLICVIRLFDYCCDIS